MDPALEDAFREQRERERELAARQGQLNSVLLNLDKMVDSYVYKVNERGEATPANEVAKIEQYLSQEVDGHFNVQTQQWVRGHYDELVRTADDPSAPGNQSIALASLGFSTRPETLSVLLNGVESENLNVSNSAVLALAIFKDERTPAAVLVRCVNQKERPMSMRTNAAWALYQVQTAAINNTEIVEFWKSILGEQDEKTDPGILVTAVRGMGLTRNPELTGYVVKHVSDPTPQVRMASAIALGRMQNPATHEALLALLGPAEINANVRLAGRKALQALAGGTDRRYDVEGWRLLFKRDG
jgi:HEAT repeat protein